MTETAAKAAEAEAAEAARHAPLALPAGSFELGELEKVGQRAVSAAPAKRDEVVSKGLADANQRVNADEDIGRLPGHVSKEVERTLVAGSEREVPGGKRGEKEIVGEVTVTETIQVFDPKLAEDEIAATDEASVAAPEAGAGTRAADANS